MRNKLFALLIIFIAIFAFAGSSIADVYSVNIYGASAQYLFWNDAADDYMGSIGCTGIQQASTGDKKHGITKGTLPGGDTLYIRYSSKASYDGIYSCKGVVPPPTAGGQPSCASVGPRYREMADPNTITSWTTGGVGGLACYEVTIGASDVAGSTFGQVSMGDKYGPLGGVWTVRNIQAIDTSDLDTYYRPLVVPFGFFANRTLDPNTVTNLTRLQAVLIFSGNATNWGDFGPMYDPNKDIIACLRHAGSGTHATLDATVMRKDTWPLAIVQSTGRIWFNDGSSDMMRCLAYNGDPNNATNLDTAAAVGYADADQIVAKPEYAATCYGLDYQGASPSKDNIVNGVYDFWSPQWLYECDPDADSTVHGHVEDLADFASDPNNLPSSKAAFWATQNEMNVQKASDRAYPKFK